MYSHLNILTKKIILDSGETQKPRDYSEIMKILVTNSKHSIVSCMLNTLTALHVIFHYQVDAVISIFQVKLRHIEVEWLPQGHIGSKRQSQNLCQENLVLRLTPLTTILYNFIQKSTGMVKAIKRQIRTHNSF